MNEEEEALIEFETFRNFWQTIINAIEAQTNEHCSNDQLFRKLYFMNGLLQAASNLLKVFMQEFYPSFTPEMQEQMDLQLSILIRRFGGNVIQKTKGDFKINE